MPRRHRGMTYLQESMQDVDQLGDLLPSVLRGARVGNAAPDVILQDYQSNFLACSDNCGQLRQYIRAIRVFLDHSLDAPNLPLDFLEPGLKVGRVLPVGAMLMRLALRGSFYRHWVETPKAPAISKRPTHRK